MNNNINKLNFQEYNAFVISEIEKLGGYNVRYLTETPSKRHDKDKYKTIKFDIPKEEKHFVVNTLKDNLSELGCQVFCVAPGSREMFEEELCVLKSHNKYDILRVFETNGINHGLETEDIIDKLSKWDKEYGVNITGANFDWIKIEIKEPPFDDLGGFAQEIYKFCPDCVDQGCGDIELLEFALENNLELFLWWD